MDNESKFPRSSGILLHPTSLPGRFGIGELGEEARRFVEFLREAGQSLWQVLPLGPTGFGNSPYQSFSAFAGNTQLISLETLEEEGLLEAGDLQPVPGFDFDRVDFTSVKAYKASLLERAWMNFRKDSARDRTEDWERFRSENHAWLGDYSLFMALRRKFENRPWTDWSPEVRNRRPGVLERLRKELRDEIEKQEFLQFLFFRQWEALKRYCRERGIRIMGDIPIFVAHDSVDVWANPEQFDLHEDGRPRTVAGVPPDYFSATGQLWGNPLYRWERMAEDGFSWWIERLRTQLRLTDLVRLDHFRGFEASWEIPGEARDAVDGRWVEGPGAAFFEAVEEELGSLPIVAENLGLITPEVEELRRRFRFPGMAILQFAFGGEPSDSAFLPHNYERNLFAYTGTHDNDTTVGWWNGGGPNDSTRNPDQVRWERELARRYLGISGEGEEVHWEFIRAVMTSVADSVVIPLQDVLGLGTESRMNLPGTAEGNWRWRFREEALSPEAAERLRELSWLSGRTRLRPSWA